MADLQPLKSCPFCGSAAKLSFSRDREVVTVLCYWWGKGCMGAGANEVSEEAARTAWNRRTPSPASHEQVEALHPTTEQLDAALAERQWPSNPRNAARAGWYAALKAHGLHDKLPAQWDQPKQGESE